MPETLGEWQKIYVRKLVDSGLSYEHAMIAMGVTCDQRQKSYMQGYEKGFNDGNDQALKGIESYCQNKLDEDPTHVSYLTNAWKDILALVDKKINNK